MTQLTYPCERCNRDDGYPICHCERVTKAAPVEKAAPVPADREGVRRELMAMARCDVITDRHRIVIGAALGHLASAQQAAQPVATDKDSLTVAPAGRLHADGYFTWHRRDGYVMDRRLPCDFYLTPAAAPAPVGLVPLTDERVSDLIAAIAQDQFPTVVKLFALVRATELAHGIKAGKDGAA